jgi:hypothetical protein
MTQSPCGDDGLSLPKHCASNHLINSINQTTPHPPTVEPYQGPPVNPVDHPKVVDWRYRSSGYFLEDQLRQSEAAQDFRSVKRLLSTLVRLSLRTSYEFTPVLVQVDVPPNPRRR